MANQDLGFNVFAHDRAGKTFVQLAERIDRVSRKLDELDRKEANPEIDIDVDRAMAQARRAARAFADGAEEEGAKRKRGFFLAMFTPNRSIVTALRTGVPAALGSPIGAAAITLGGVFAASFVGAVLSSGAFAAIGGGFTAVAAVALKENQRLKDSFAELGSSAKSDLVQAATPLVPTFDKALSQVQGMFGEHIADPLEDIFAGLEPTIVPFAESAVRTVGNILDRLSTPEFLESTREVLDALSREMPRLGDEIGQFFTTLAENSDDIAEAFGNVVTVTGGLLQFGARAVNTFTDLFNIMSDIARLELKNLPGPQFSPDDPESAQSTLETIQALNDLALKAFPGVSDPIGDYIVETGRAGDMTAKFEAEIRGLNNRAEQAARDGLAELEQRQEQLTDAIDSTSDRLSQEQDKLEALKDSMFAAAEGVLGLRDSTRSYEEAVDAASETIGENGETLDVNTEKGRENQAAIDEIAASALGHIQIMIEQGKSTEKVTKFTQNARDEFINAAEAAGMETEKAEALADKLGLIPSDVKTKIQAIDQMSATIDSLKRQIRELQRMAGIVPINASIGSFFGSSHIRPQDFHTGGMIGPELPRAHSGMLLRPDERVVIGQTGERILSRQQTARFDAAGGVDALMRGGMGGGGHLTGELYLSSGEFLGVVQGQVERGISEHNRGLNRRSRAGTGRVR